MTACGMCVSSTIAHGCVQFSLHLAVCIPALVEDVLGYCHFLVFLFGKPNGMDKDTRAQGKPVYPPTRSQAVDDIK